MKLPDNLREPYLIGRAVVRVLRDSTRTDEIHRVEELTGRRAYRRILKHSGVDDDLAALLHEQPELDLEHVDYNQLRTLPPGSLGHTYVHHLDSNGIEAVTQANGTRHIDDPDVAYLMRRFRQTHDVWHALLGLGIAGHEEVIIHAFSYGQLRLPVSAMVVLFGSIKHMVLERRWGALRHALLEAYQIGRRAAPLLPVYWERIWAHSIDEVRARYRVQMCSPALVHG